MYILLVLFAIVFFGPFLIMILGSLKEMRTFHADPRFLIPNDISLANYEFIFTRGPILRWLFNSAVITVIPVLSQIFLCTLLGYIFAKKQFKGKEIIFWTMMAMVMIPKQLLIIPHYIMYSWFDWINTYYPLIVPELWAIMGVFCYGNSCSPFQMNWKKLHIWTEQETFAFFSKLSCRCLFRRWQQLVRLHL